MNTDEPADDGDASSTSEDSSRLAQVMAATRQTVQARFAELKAGFTHTGPKGAGGEALVAEFLQKHLPEQIGATAGQVVDSTGAMSKQVDVVLYDRARTPMLFTSPNGIDSLIPIEGVLAVIEVKTHLKKSMLSGILENCRSVKRLQRSAYFDRPFRATYRVYDREWVDFPVYYSVFANVSDNMYAGELNELQYEVDLQERIDSICYLDKGANLNASISSASREAQVAASASEGSVLIDIQSENALLHWYGAIASMVAQAEVRPINILAYMGKEMRVSGRVPGGRATQDMYNRLRAEVVAASGVSVETLERFQGRAITKRDTYDLLRSSGFQAQDVDADEQLRPMREDARNMSFEEWQERWDIN